MFDLYFVKKFDGEAFVEDMKKKFTNFNIYNNIRKVESSLSTDSSFYSILERDQNSNNVFKNNDLIIAVYGSVFSTRQFASKYNRKPWKLTPEEIASLFLNEGDDFAKNLKGSFVIVVENKNQVKVITDSLNVLPLYYYYSNNTLIISSCVRMILANSFVSRELDELAITELALYDYMLKDHYFYKKIRKFENGRIYSFTDGQIHEKKYWSIEKLFNSKLLARDESLDLLSDLLKENVELYTSDYKQVLVSFTGGFDGRTNVAMLEKDKADFLCYSYGKPGSKQIDIPKLISAEMGINYKPVYLDKDFENSYALNASLAIEFSNGTAPHSRANYPYAFSKLNSFSDMILTGLFGSEILRPYNPGQKIFTNEKIEILLTSKKFEEDARIILNDLIASNLVEEQILRKYFDMAIEPLIEYQNRYKDLGELYPYFFFFLEEGVRKYFMQEIQVERPFVTTRFPYFDHDFVELIHKTPFAGMYNGFLGKSKAKRRNGQLLYAYLMKKFNPLLNQFELDRGYKPGDLLKPFPLNYINLFLGARKAKKYIRFHGNDTFDTTGIWSKNFFASEYAIVESGSMSVKRNLDFENSLSFSHNVSMRSFLKNENAFKVIQ